MKKDVRGKKVELKIHPLYWAGFLLAKIGQMIFTLGVKIMSKFIK